MEIKLNENQKIALSNPSKVQQIMKNILDNESELDQGKENLWVIGTNIKNVILYIELVHLGTSNYTIIEPKQILRTAIFHNADGIIIVHNHPSGIITPSKEDNDLTKKLKEACNVTGIPLLDHVIISNINNLYYSFQESYLI